MIISNIQTSHGCLVTPVVEIKRRRCKASERAQRGRRTRIRRRSIKMMRNTN